MLIITFGSLTNYGGSKRGARGRIEGRGEENRERRIKSGWKEN